MSDRHRPRPLSVPAALRSRTRFEPSAALWLPSLDRYLLISDDTGLRGSADEDAPWLFLMDTAGRVDAEPWPLLDLPAAGFSTVSDLEAVTRAPDGALWLLSSQSRSARGKRKPERQLLIRCVLNDGRLHVTHATPLLPALTPLLDDDGAKALDIEAMTWADGGLLLGLKAPLDAQGRAQLWHLADPLQIFTAAADAPTPVRPFVPVRLPTGTDGAPGGFSDLALHDRTLWATSTLADGPDVGCAWALPWPLRDGAPVRRLAQWPGLKPEAVCLGPDGPVVFFDAQPPQWCALG